MPCCWCHRHHWGHPAEWPEAAPPYFGRYAYPPREEYIRWLEEEREFLERRLRRLEQELEELRRRGGPPRD